MATTGTSTPFLLAGLGQPNSTPNPSQHGLSQQAVATGPYQQAQLQNVYSGYSSGPPPQPQIIDRVLVFDTDREINKHRFLIKWMNADAMAIFEGRIGCRYKEIIIMKMGYTSSSHFREAAEEIINCVLPTMLVPGGRIVNLNDVEEGEDEPQGLSEQADASKPDAGRQCDGADAPVLPVQREAGGSD